ncbi:alkaline phosphatase family protein, partial [Acidobacteriota bacterium]
FLKLSLATGSLAALGKSPDIVTKTFGKTETAKKIIILGFDGMDPHLLEVWMNQGKLPAFERLRNHGGFCSLKTSLPPQSPVAWSNFITGMNPGGHGIFDFIHRNPDGYLPEFSATKTQEGGKTISIGNLVFPISGGKVEQKRQGKAFWQILEEHNIPATIFKIPANYPPAPTKQRTLSGMNTPDILGTYGIFNYYTTQVAEVKEDIGGARIHEVYMIGNSVEAKLPGPINSFKKHRPESSVDFKVFVDPVNPVAKIVIQDQEFILKEKEWSGWKRIRYNLIPTQSVAGICMFYLKQTRPEFKLYVSPVNIDPASPAMPISTPKNYSNELEKKFGPFFTKGLPADTSALDNDVLDEGEFLELDDYVMRERLQMFDYELSRFESGAFFYYFSSTDQRQHMFWRLIDKNHPSYESKLASKYGNTIENIYKEMDKVVDKTISKLGKNTILLVMSDHGFAPFRRSFNLNSWLKENGYLNLIDPSRQGEEPFFLNTDWSRTKAYALGLNSLYINQMDRESEGIVSETGKQALVREIAQKLESFKDPKTGIQAILKAYMPKNVYQGADTDKAPDLIIGYNRGYRVSWSTPLGRIPKNILEDNMEKWSGDHLMDPSVCPGILLANQKIKLASPALYDLTATILKVFDIDTPKEMIGQSIF